MLELASGLTDAAGGARTLTLAAAQEVASGTLRRFDKGGDQFYEQISALHKSVRGSDPDAALYWLCRMLDGGCDPTYLARRIMRMAYEDVGLADPRAFSVTLDAWEAYDRLGSPEGELALANTVVYLACAPRSNALSVALGEALGRGEIRYPRGAVAPASRADALYEESRLRARLPLRAR
jgi:putative ATPase